MCSQRLPPNHTLKLRVTITSKSSEHAIIELVKIGELLCENGRRANLCLHCTFIAQLVEHLLLKLHLHGISLLHLLLSLGRDVVGVLDLLLNSCHSAGVATTALGAALDLRLRLLLGTLRHDR